MKITRRKLLWPAAVLIAASAALTGGATQAQASVAPTGPATNVTTQTAQASVVANFVAKNPAPVVTSKDPVVFQKQNDDAFKYWSEAPIASMLGQWGRSASDINVAQQTLYFRPQKLPVVVTQRQDRQARDVEARADIGAIRPPDKEVVPLSTRMRGAPAGDCSRPHHHSLSFSNG